MTFNVSFYLLSGEKEDYFTWVLEVLQSLLTNLQIPRPYTIITDYDKAFKKACRKIFDGDIQY